MCEDYAQISGQFLEHRNLGNFLNTEATSWDALGGSYQLCPGRERSVVGQRPVLGAGRLAGLLRGQKDAQVGQTLTSVHPLVKKGTAPRFEVDWTEGAPCYVTASSASCCRS
jgi:hypothetical protein